MLKIGMNSPIVRGTTQHAIFENAPSARPHASMMSDISQGLETITIGWMTALTVTGLMTVVSAAPTSQPRHQKSVAITIRDPHVEVQFKADVVAQEHYEVSANATGRAELVAGSKHILCSSSTALFRTSRDNHAAAGIHLAFPSLIHDEEVILINDGSRYHQ